jgi:hypothetical protein
MSAESTGSRGRIPAVTWLEGYRARVAMIGALLGPLVVGAVLANWRGAIASVAAVLIMIMVVAVVATAGSRAAGVLASLGAAIWFDFFLTAPYLRLTISHRPDLEATLGIVVVGLVITELAVRNRAHRSAVDESSEFVVDLHRIAALCAGPAGLEAILDEASAILASLMFLRACRFDHALAVPALARIGSDAKVAHVGMLWDAEAIGIPGPESEIVAEWRGEVLGRFVITPTPGQPVSRVRRVAAVTVVDVVAGRVAAWRAGEDSFDDGEP